MKRFGIVGSVLALAAVAGARTPVQVTERVSLSSAGTQGNQDSGAFRSVSMSTDGRFVAFSSRASNLVPRDTNGCHDAFVRDRASGTTERVSVSAGGAEGNDSSGLDGVSISADGGLVVFTSQATNLVAGDTNGSSDVFVRDRRLGTTELASVSTTGGPANSLSLLGSSSGDGRFVVFLSLASNLVAGDSNTFADVFVRDRLNGTTEIASLSSGSAQGNGPCATGGSAISPNGRFVAFTSSASNVVPGDMNGHDDVFVRDRWTGTTERASLSSTGVEANEDCGWPAISADGRLVAFATFASNLAPGDTNGALDVYVRDRRNGTTERVSISTSGVQGTANCSLPSISADGRFVAFGGNARHLVPDDRDFYDDVFVHDRRTHVTERVDVSDSQRHWTADSGSLALAISPDGRFVVFESNSSNLVPGDTNGRRDVFLRDLGPRSSRR